MIISAWKCKGKNMSSQWKLILTKLFPMKININIFKYLLLLILLVSLTSCGSKAASQDTSVDLNQINQGSQANHGKLSRKITEVSPPVVIQELRQRLEVYQPQVKITTPKPEEVLQDNSLKVNFRVKDLPVFKNSQFGLGPHLQVILDDEPYQEVYELDQPLEIPNLSAGTHTLRVFASSPWYEGFKNEGAYDQVTFHVFTKSDDNNPDPKLPLLTYSRPQSSYGAEPILLDFYLTNAPLHLVAKEEDNQKIGDWRIRCTVNGESFILDRWQSLYLKGFKPGKNWVKLEFLDGQGNPVKNVFNSTIRTITYNPGGKDTLAQIARGELKADELRSIIDPKYVVKKPVVQPAPTVTPIPTPTPTPKVEVKPAPKTTPTSEAKSQIQPQAKESLSPSPVVPETPKVIKSPPTEVKEVPSQTTPVVKPTQSLQTSPKSIESQSVKLQPQVTPKSSTETIAADKEVQPKPEVEVKPESKAESQSKTAPQPETEVKQAATEKLRQYFKSLQPSDDKASSSTSSQSDEVEIKANPEPEAAVPGGISAN